MRPDELARCLITLRWSPETMADALGCGVDVVQDWLDGVEKIPPKTKVWVSFLALNHREADSERPTTIRGKKLTPRPFRLIGQSRKA